MKQGSCRVELPPSQPLTIKPNWKNADVVKPNRGNLIRPHLLRSQHLASHRDNGSAALDMRPRWERLPTGPPRRSNSASASWRQALKRSPNCRASMGANAYTSLPPQHHMFLCNLFFCNLGSVGFRRISIQAKGQDLCQLLCCGSLSCRGG